MSNLSHTVSTQALKINTYSVNISKSKQLISTLENEISALNVNASNYNQVVSSMKTEIAALKANVSNATANFKFLQTNFNSLQASISSLLSKIYAKNHVIGSLTSTVTSLNSSLNSISSLQSNFLSFMSPSITNLSASFLNNSYPNGSYYNYAMFTGAAWNGSQFLVVGSKGADGFNPINSTYIAGLYNPSVNKFTSLNTSSLGKGWFKSAAWNGTNFLVVGEIYNTSKSSDTSVSPNLFVFSPSTATFKLVDNLSAYNWVISSVIWNGTSFILSGNAEFNNGSSVPKLASYSASAGFVPISSNLGGYKMTPTSDGPIFNSISWTGNGYIVMSDMANSTFPGGAAGNVTFIKYSPSFTYEGNYTSDLINYYTNGAAVWDGHQLFVVNAIPGKYTIGVFSPNTSSYKTLYTTSNGVPGVPAFDGYSFLIPGLYNLSYPFIEMYS